jgi:hypothetical protein
MKTIKLYTKGNREDEMHLVTELDFNKNAGLYMMVERGTAPNVIMWGERFFVVKKTISEHTYVEEFCMAVF